MRTLISIQQWLYQSMGRGLGDIAGGSPRAILLAMSAAVLFGAVHALMPGHGTSSPIISAASRHRSFAIGAILALTHVGLAVVLELAGFAVIKGVCL